MQPQDPNTDWQQPGAAPLPGVEAGDSAQPMTVDDAAVATDQPAVVPQAREGDDELVRWQAAEHINRDQDTVWYSVFAAIVVLLIVGSLLLLKSWTFTVLIPVMAAALVVYTRRPPALIDYTLSRKGLHINDRLHSFEEFKSFGLVRDDDENSILLVPRKRFQFGTTIYFPDDAGEAVVDLLAARLPMHEITLDPIDRLIRKLRI